MDRILIEQINNENAVRIFESLFHLYYPSLCSYAFGMVKNHEDAKDIVNDCFYEFWKKRHALEIRTSVKSYLYIAVRNSAINYLRKKNLEHKYSSTQTYPFYLQEEVTARMERLLQMEDLESRLKKAIDMLPDQCRYIFHLNRYQQLGYKEIALKLNLSVGTVKTQIARALKKLRAEFEDVNEDNQIFLFLIVRHFYSSLSYQYQTRKESDDE